MRDPHFASRLTPAVRRRLDEENRKHPTVLTLVEGADLQRAEGAVPPKFIPARVWRSRKYLVQEFAEDGTPTRLSVCRTSLNKNGHFEDGLTWDELQTIKNEIGYGDAWAVEIYPDDKHIVRDANMRHLWIVPRPFFAWKKS